MQGKEAHILEVIQSPAYPSKQKKFKMAANIINVKFYLNKLNYGRVNKIQDG